MKQRLRSALSLPVVSTAPTLVTDGIAVDDAAKVNRHGKYVATVSLVGGATVELVGYGYVNGVWGLLSDVGNLGALLGGSALATGVTRHLEFDGAGICTRIALVRQNDVGAALVVPDFTFTAANATEIFTAAAHGLLTGDGPLRVSTSGALPAGLLAATDYWFIKIDADTFYLATTLANALAGTHLSITTDGTGVQTAADVGGTQRVVAPTVTVALVEETMPLGYDA